MYPFSAYWDKLTCMHLILKLARGWLLFDGVWVQFAGRAVWKVRWQGDNESVFRDRGQKCIIRFA